MPSSNLDVQKSPEPSTKPQKAAGLAERADQVAQEIVGNLSRHRREKEAAKKQAPAA